MFRHLIFTIFYLICITAYTQSHYATYLNNFASFFDQAKITANCESHVSDKDLVISNKFSDDLIITDTLSSGMRKFRFYIRAANLNNKANKSYEYTSLSDGNKHKLDNPVFGIVWGYTDKQNFYAAILQCSNSYLYDDLIDTRAMTVNIIRVHDSSMKILKTVKLDEGADLYTGYNIVNIEYDGEKTSLSIGNKVPRYIAQFSDISYPAKSRCGVFIGPAAQLAIERIVFKSQPIMEIELATKWNLESLSKHFEKSQDAHEGFWTFFDKELDEKKLKLGGRYTIALVKNGNGYDIIYVTGAQVNKSKWSCGMLKGHIGETQFVDNFSLMWYDAMMKPFINDVYATIENYMLLSLHFPAQKSVMRFAKSLNYQKNN